MSETTLYPQSRSEMEVLEMSQGFHRVDGDKFQFLGTYVVYRMGDEIYRAASKNRFNSSQEIRSSDQFEDVTLIPISAYAPSFSPEYHTEVAQSVSEGAYLKKPALIGYTPTASTKAPQSNPIADYFLKEVQICEVLKQYPHPNVATYLGCEVTEDHITGLCFPRYHQTLMQMVNPGGHSKRDAKLPPGDETKDWNRILAGIESGIRHLHSLGIVHNDINPSNIMFDGDTPVIIDFGSCRKVGRTLSDVGRTYEWHNEKVRVSLRKNDMDALEEMRIWLGQSTKSFMFEG